MQNLNNFIKGNLTIFIIVFFLGGIIFVQYSDKKSKTKREYLKIKGGFAIGEFTDRSWYNINGGGVSSVGYDYVVNARKINGSDTRCDQDSRMATEAFIYKAKVGDRFLVLYDLSNPNKSIIRLDFPIKDSTDFKRYVQEFEEMRRNK